MQTQQKVPAAHWSIHPWKLTGILAALLTVLSSAYLAVMFALINGGLWSTAEPTQIMVLSLLPLLLLGAAYAALTAIVLRTQARQGLQGSARNSISWAALPGFAVVLALACLAFAQAAYAKNSQINLNLNNFSQLIGSIVIAALPALVNSMLLTVWKKLASLTVGALMVAAVLFVPMLIQQMILMSSGGETQLLPWLVVEPLQQTAMALVAAALFTGTGRRLWDALALQWGIYLLVGFLMGLWRATTGANTSQWFGSAQQILVWLLPALIALYCLIQWDRGVSPAGPFKALGRRIGALARHFLPT